MIWGNLKGIPIYYNTHLLFDRVFDSQAYPNYYLDPWLISLFNLSSIKISFNQFS